MHRIFSIGYSFVGLAAFSWVLCGSFCHSESFYCITVVPERCFQIEPLAGGWALGPSELTEQVPDLRQELVFLGINGRPDAAKKNVFLKLSSSGQHCLTAMGERIYLVKTICDSFSFSTEPTDLWIECLSLKEERIEVGINLIGLNGELVKKALVLPKRAEPLVWEIGGIRVDPSFGVKQKMRRVGCDRFLAMYGGAEYADKAAKERVDFSSLSGENYCRYLTEGDLLLWDGDRWQTMGVFQGNGELVPLLEVSRIDEKFMTLTLWDVNGLAHQTINLVKMTSSPMEIAEILKELSFVGMRTWTKPILQAGNDRLVLSPDDWVIYTDAGWKKVLTRKQIEDYLSGSLQTPLLVFHAIEHEEQGMVLAGHLFNAQRTLVESITLPLKQTIEEASPAGNMGG